MTIPSVSSSSPAVPADTKSTAQKVKADMKSLANALNTDDLTSARKAFATLQKDLPKKPAAPGADSTANSLTSLAAALKSGDVSGAKKALATLQQVSRTAQQSKPAGAAAAASASQSLVASAAQEAMESAAQTKAEAAKGDQQAIRKLAAINAKNPPPPAVAAQIVSPPGTGKSLDVVV